MSMTSAKYLRDPTTRAPLIGNSVETILEFVKWTQGQKALDPALNALNNLLGAEAICFARRDFSKSGLRTVGTIDRNTDPRKPRFDTPFAFDVLGNDLDKLKAGVAFLLSDVDAQRDPTLERWMHVRDVRDVAVFCVGSQSGVRDILEIHFRRKLPNGWITEADKISKSLAEIFAGSRPGLVEQYLVVKSDCRPDLDDEKENALILAPDNAAGLTRSEWRLCILIANGLSRDGAAHEMGVTDNTIRTHLRHIYGKTGCKSFHDLARRLVRVEEQRALESLAFGHAA